MKRKIQLATIVGFFAVNSASSQNCATINTIGSSANSYTNLIERTNSIAVDKDLNTIVFIHRNNSSNFDGNSGELRYDLSTDGGNIWNTDLGILNPSAGILNPPARYPQVCIHNPTGNTNPNNAFLTYFAPNLNNNIWDGSVSGVRKLNGTGNTENYNQAGTSSSVHGSMVKGTQGVFWNVVRVSDSDPLAGIQILKGTWNNALQDVQWTNNNVINPNFETSEMFYPDYHISFSPSGQIGWVSMTAKLTGITSNDSYPILYRTLNGGATWSGPFVVPTYDGTQFPCINNNASFFIGLTDLTVDINGSPHLLTSTGLDITLSPNSVSNPSALNFQIFKVFNEGTSLQFTDGADQYSIYSTPLITRNSNGTKIFFAINGRDNSTYATNPNETNISNLYSKGLDVSTMNWTQVKNFSSCNEEANGKIFFPKIANEVLQPSLGSYKIALIYTALNSGDLELPTDFKFLNGIIWHDSDFIFPHITSAPSITATATSTSLCEGASLTLTATGNATTFQWVSNFSADIQNGTSFIPNSYTPNFIASGDLFTAIAWNALGCVTSFDIPVTFLPSPSINISTISPSICAGANQVLSASSSTSNVFWTPGNLSGTSINVQPNSTTTYTASTTSTNGCSAIEEIVVNVNQLPQIIANASLSEVCAGDEVTLFGTGTADTFTWNNGVVNAQAFQPNATNTYTLTGTNTTTNCSNTANITVAVNPLPIVTANSPDIVFCLDASGPALAALPFGGTWSGAGINNNSFSPIAAGAGEHSIAYSYTDNNGCTNTAGLNMTVHALPNVTINSSAATICSGSSVTLNGEGADSYLWTNDVIDGESFVPSTTSSYVVTGTDLNGCVNSASATVTVNTTPVVTNQSANQTATIGTDISFFVEAAQTIDTYQWQTNTGFGWQNLNDFGQYAGSSSNTLTISSLTNSNNNQPFRCIINLGDCSDTSAIAILTTTDVGIDAISGTTSDLNFEVYPNPFTEQTKVVFEQVQNQTEINILDARGQLVKRLNFSGKHLVIDREDVANGIYFIHVNDDGQNRLTKKLVLI